MKQITQLCLEGESPTLRFCFKTLLYFENKHKDLSELDLENAKIFSSRASILLTKKFLFFIQLIFFLKLGLTVTIFLMMRKSCKNLV